jgi:hypothetical protein
MFQGMEASYNAYVKDAVQNYTQRSGTLAVPPVMPSATFLPKATVSGTYERNEKVTITNGTETRTLKFKKAEALIASGQWRMVN